MARKIVRKMAKTSTKRQTKPVYSTSTAEAVEKELKTIPAKLASIYGKNLATAKQQENTLKNELKKAQAQKKTAKDKYISLTAKTAKAKLTPTSRKQLSTAKQTYNTITKTIDKLLIDLNKIKHSCEVFAKQQKKFISLGKELAKFESQWVKAARAKPKTTKARKKSIKVSKPDAIQSEMEFSSPIHDILQTPELPAAISSNEVTE